jgi:hypothetical protein
MPNHLTGRAVSEERLGRLEGQVDHVLPEGHLVSTPPFRVFVKGDRGRGKGEKEGEEGGVGPSGNKHLNYENTFY